MPSIKDFSKLLEIEPDILLHEAKNIGVIKNTVDEALTNEEKKLLTPWLQKLTLDKKTVTNMKATTRSPTVITSTTQQDKENTQSKQSKTYIDVTEQTSPRNKSITKRSPAVKIVGSTIKAKPKNTAKNDTKAYVLGASAKPSKSGISEISSKLETPVANSTTDTKPSEAPKTNYKNTNRSNLSSPSKRKGKHKHTYDNNTDSLKPKTFTQIIREVKIPETITLSELADKMAIKSSEVIKLLMNLGTMVKANQLLDQDTAVLIVEEMGHKPIIISEDELEQALISSTEEVTGKLTKRAPIVTIMGHVDHGKTSLLDYIRNSQVTKNEHGGITQHIGAYNIIDKNNNSITFIDTPGHEAFTAMRARGAKITDIVTLIVAADDGVKPQTIEAIKHARAAEVPIVVAITKVDKEDTNIDKVMQELSAQEIIPEAWGGNHQIISVSSKTGQGIDELVEAIILETEILELQAIEECPAKGIVIESKLDKGQGSIATVIIMRGTLKKSDIVVCGHEYGKVKLLIDENNTYLTKATPSLPVQIVGLSNPPLSGDEMIVVDNEKKAKEISTYRRTKSRNIKIASQQKTKLSTLHTKMQEGSGTSTSISVLIKADVQGSIEAITNSFDKISTEEVNVKVITSAVGGITESDVNLAIASNAIIIGFNVRADSKAKIHANKENITLYYFSIIYDVIDTLKEIMQGELAPEIKEQIVGIAEVREVFIAPKIGQIAGCIVTEGVVKKNNPIRVLRDSVVIYEGKLESLRRFKEDVTEVKNNIECGIGVKGYNDVKVKDLIEVFELTTVKKTI